MKNLIFPSGVIKVSPSTNSVYVANKYKKELLNNFSLSKLVSQENNNFIINLEIDNNYHIKLNLTEKYIVKFIQEFKSDLSFNIINKDVYLKRWDSNNLYGCAEPINIEIIVDKFHCTKLSKYSFNYSYNNVKNIILHNVYSIPMNICDSSKHNTITIKNYVPENPIIIAPQIAPNLILDLSDIKNINFSLPLFNIEFEGDCFFKGINWWSILDQILYGPSFLLNKKVNFVSNCSIHSKNVFRCDEKNKKLLIRTPITSGLSNNLILFKKLSKILKTKIDSTKPISYHTIWLAFAKHQKDIKNDYYYSQSITEQPHYRGEILDRIINIIEEKIKNPNTDYHSLSVYKDFEAFIQQISKNKK